MAADLFETYVVSTVAVMLLGSFVFKDIMTIYDWTGGGETTSFGFLNALVYPLLIGAVSMRHHHNRHLVCPSGKITKHNGSAL